jgi:hypothetical protein
METPITTPITLTSLSAGPHVVEVIGRNDAGFYQDDSDFGANAVVTRSRTWFVQTAHPDFNISSIEMLSNVVQVHFPVLAGNSYTVQFTTALDGSAPWQKLTNITSVSVSGDFVVSDSSPENQARFYRVVTPAQP